MDPNAGQPSVPQSREAEAMVLGAILKSADLFYRVQDLLKADDFYSAAHMRVFETICEMMDRTREIDYFTLSEALKRKGILEEVGGMSYIAELEDLVPAKMNVEEYARIIREKAVLRRVIDTVTRVLQQAHGEVEDVEKFVDETEQLIFRVTQNDLHARTKPMKDLVKDYLKKLETVSKDPASLQGIPSGFADLDHLTHGFQPGDLIIVAGRPSMGKTSFCLNMAAHAAFRARRPVMVFTLEMSAELLVMRLFSSEARVNSMDLRRALIPPEAWEKLAGVAGRIAQSPMEIEDSGHLNVREIRSRCRRLRAEKRLDLILIDYLQLLGGTGAPGRGGRTSDREREVAEISRSLKTLAKELEVPCVAVSQLNRQVEQREKKKPQLADLRESGAIEQDADLILFLYRPGYYKETPDPHDRTVELGVGKNRNGPTGEIELAFFPEFNRFESKAQETEVF
ncbi:MAG: replicative DNA helicase [Nitrospirae bacterium]|nr:replicative DNA helicase [Nitrospirota bacterium]